MDPSHNEEVFGIKRQTIAFIRHGVARHNVLDRHGNAPDLKNPELFDPPLVLEGKMQAVEVGEKLRIWWRTTQVGEYIELVITSPLTRCLQTTALAFHVGEYYTKALPEPTIACMDLVREAYGMSYPDRRRSLEFLRCHWPSFHFDPSMTNEDDAWKLTERETVPDVLTRINQFLQWLVTRSENNIVVVSHGVWIECCFHAHSPETLQESSEVPADRVRNGDLFVGECVSLHGQFQRMENVRRVE